MSRSVGGKMTLKECHRETRKKSNLQVRLISMSLHYANQNTISLGPSAEEASSGNQEEEEAQLAGVTNHDL